MSTLSHLLLKRVLVRELRLVSEEVPDSEPSEGGVALPSEPTMSFTMQRRGDSPAFRIFMRFGMQFPAKKKHAFSVSVHLVGEFGFSSDVDEETIKKYIPVLGIANLLGVVRGMVANATALFPNGPIIIPLFDAHRLIEKSLEEDSQGDDEESGTASGEAEEVHEIAPEESGAEK